MRDSANKMSTDHSMHNTHSCYQNNGYSSPNTESSPQKCLHCAEQETLSVAALVCLVWSGVYPVVDKMCMCMCV